MTDPITDLPAALRAHGWCVVERRNALVGHQFHWGMQTPPYAMPGRKWAQRQGLTPAQRRAVPPDLITWVERAIEDVLPVLTAFETVVPSIASARDLLRACFVYHAPRRVQIVATVACFAWTLTPQGSAWRVRPPVWTRSGSLLVSAAALAALWAQLDAAWHAHGMQPNQQVHYALAAELLAQPGVRRLDATGGAAGRGTNERNP